MNRTIREDLEREVGHDHGVRHTKNVVGVGRAVEGEDADLRRGASTAYGACVSSRRGARAKLSVGRDAIDARLLVDAAV